MPTEASWPGRNITQAPALSSHGITQASTAFSVSNATPTQATTTQAAGGAGVGVNVVRQAPTSPPQTTPAAAPVAQAAPVLPIGPATAEARFRAQFRIYPLTATELI